MLRSEETLAFLSQAQQLSADWAAQALFVRDVFLPQIEALNQHIADRSHVPEVSREVLTTYMRKSEAVKPYMPRIACIAQVGEHVGGMTRPKSYFAQSHTRISTESLISVFFPSDLLVESLGPDHDFALYFDARYKATLVGSPHANTKYGDSPWNHHNVPVRIFTNYDFYIEISVEKSFVESTCTSGGSTGTFFVNVDKVVVRPVPLSGQDVVRAQISLAFVSLAPTQNLRIAPLLNPSPVALGAFLAQRKPYVHPVIVLDYLREQPLAAISAYFGDISQHELAEAKNALTSEQEAHARTAAELDTCKQGQRAYAAQREKENESVKLQLSRLMGEPQALDGVQTVAEITELEKTLRMALERVEEKAIALKDQHNQRGQRLCVICQELEKTVLMLPCRHLCLCAGCAGSDLLTLCPLCRAPIADKINVFA